MALRHGRTADHRLRATLVQMGCLALAAFWAALGTVAVHELRAAHPGAVMAAHLHSHHLPGTIGQDSRRA